MRWDEGVARLCEVTVLGTPDVAAIARRVEPALRRASRNDRRWRPALLMVATAAPTAAPTIPTSPAPVLLLRVRVLTAVLSIALMGSAPLVLPGREG
jgi:hypothetical protein